MYVFKKILKKIISFLGYEVKNIKYRQGNVLQENRIDISLSAKKNLTNDFFGGWDEEDIQLLEKYKHKFTKKLEEGFIYDWLGVVTSKKFHGWIEYPDKGILCDEDLPIPDDKIHAEAIEYIALAKSFEESKNKDLYTAVELGASFSPWCSSGGVIAKRLGFKNINLISVEASSSGKEKIMEQFANNNLLDDENIKTKIIEGAISTENGTVFFPKVNVKNDNGAQITTNKADVDYRGLKIEHDEIKSYSIKTIAKDVDFISFLHMDLQGAEESLFEDSEFLECLNSKVKVLFLATQSRIIEGKATKALFGKDWTLFRERPTVYRQNDTAMNPNGWTLRDGGQIWINDKI